MVLPCEKETLSDHAAAVSAAHAASSPTTPPCFPRAPSLSGMSTGKCKTTGLPNSNRMLSALVRERREGREEDEGGGGEQAYQRLFVDRGRASLGKSACRTRQRGKLSAKLPVYPSLPSLPNPTCPCPISPPPPPTASHLRRPLPTLAAGRRACSAWFRKGEGATGSHTPATSPLSLPSSCRTYATRLLSTREWSKGGRKGGRGRRERLFASFDSLLSGDVHQRGTCVGEALDHLAEGGGEEVAWHAVGSRLKALACRLCRK